MVAICYKCGTPFTVDGKHDLYCYGCRKSETEKDTKAFFEPFNDDVFTNLLGAMLSNAREDLYNAIRRWHRAETDEEKESAYGSVVKEMMWWKSKWFIKIAGDLDGEKVLRDLIKFNENISQEEKLLLEKEIY